MMPSSTLAEQVRAAILLLYPDEITPQAKRVLESIIEAESGTHNDTELTPEEGSHTGRTEEP